jgi:hypothetical protein
MPPDHGSIEIRCVPCGDVDDTFGEIGCPIRDTLVVVGDRQERNADPRVLGVSSPAGFDRVGVTLALPESNRKI